MRLDGAAGALTHAAAQFVVSEERSQRMRHGVHVRRRNDEARLAVADSRSHTARVAGDARNSAGRGFHEGDAESLDVHAGVHAGDAQIHAGGGVGISQIVVGKGAGQHYAVDPALVNRRVELRFDPNDLSKIEVFWEGRSYGGAVPFIIGRDVRRQVPPSTTVSPPAEPTGVDYLGLVLAAHEQQTLGAIAFRDLPAPLADPPESANAPKHTAEEPS